MAQYRNNLPQLAGDLFLTDAGLETDMVFNHGYDLPAFAAHTLLRKPDTKAALQRYFESFLDLARELETGFVLDVPLWRAHAFYAEELGVSLEELKAEAAQAIEFCTGLRKGRASHTKPIVLNAVIGPRGDAYAPEAWISADEAEAYHSQLIGWLVDTDIDMISAMTLTHTSEAIGMVRAAKAAGIPIAISFTVETDGRLPSGQSLAEAIAETDAATGAAPVYYMLNCAHPSHFADALDSDLVRTRLRGLRCNASRLSHAELDTCEHLDDGDPAELAGEHKALIRLLPEVNVFGGCCGTDLRHVTAVAKMLKAPAVA